MENMDIWTYLIQQSPVVVSLGVFLWLQRRDHQEAIVLKDKRIEELTTEMQKSRDIDRELLGELKGMIAVFNNNAERLLK